MADYCLNIGEACENPFYIKWRNTFGAWDYWLFDVKQVHSISTREIGDFAPYFADIETQDRTRELLQKEAVETVKVGADDLTIGEMLGLQQILYSPRVYWLKEWDGVNAPVWRQIIPAPGGYQLYITDRNFQAIEIDFEFPAKYTLQN